MDKKFKVFLIVALLLCFLVFLYLRREQSRENFECVKIDKSLFCPREKSDIDKFRGDQDPNYKSDIQSKTFYRFLKDFKIEDIIIDLAFNYLNSSIEKESFRVFNNYKNFENSQFKKSLKLNEPKLLHKYDFIKCSSTEFDSTDLENGKNNLAKKIMSPGGVIFDKSTDDIIIFDIYNLKRFSYRDLRIKDKVGADGFFDYYPVLDSMAIPLDDTNEIYRKELLDILFVFSDLDNILEIDFEAKVYQDFIENTDKNIFEKVNKTLYDLSLENYKNKTFKMIYKTTDVKKEYTTDDLLKRIKFLEKNLKNTQKYKTCVEDIKKDKNSDKVCRIKYQRDLPPFDMGELEGKGIEAMQYDDNPETQIHSSYLDNRMTPWSNSWNNIKSEGIFSPLVFSRERKAKIFNISDPVLLHQDGFIANDPPSKQRGVIQGVRQQSNNLNPKTKADLFNISKISPLEGAPEKYFDRNLASNNFVHEDFSNREKAFKEIKKFENQDKKIHFGYPSVNLKSSFSIGFYHIPDELDSTGIGMEIVDTGEERIILVPDLYNNRIQVFKIDKSELKFFGQFGNLPYTSQRSLPMDDENHTKYEAVHDTENYNSAPGCRKLCDFNSSGEYIGPKNTDMMGNKCGEWKKFKDEELKIDNQQINEQLKMDGFKKKDFLKDIRGKLQNGENLGDTCISLNDTKEPVCVVNTDGKNILRKCFPDFKKGNDFTKVTNDDTCVDYLKEFTSRYGPIDANECLGDNDDRTLTPEEIKKGVSAKKDCLFECDPRFSYRRANIHQRQKAYKFDKMLNEERQVFRKRGHFYSLMEEYNRCRNGIQKEKETGKPSFLDAEFINPHFLGVDSQACVGVKTTDGDCASPDTRKTNGVDNCSLGYRKYLLKMINVTNQGQKFGQLFHPKSIAYDDLDKKYYVVDCYHHCVQCFEMKPAKKSTESGEKLDFVSSDIEMNDKNIFYYDENFRTAEALQYNRSKVYSLGLRQNLLYEENFVNFSRLGEVNDDVSPYAKSVFKAREYIFGIEDKFKEIDKLIKEMESLNTDKSEGIQFSKRGKKNEAQANNNKANNNKANNTQSSNTNEKETIEGFENSSSQGEVYNRKILKLVAESKKSLGDIASNLSNIPEKIITDRDKQLYIDKIKNLFDLIDDQIPSEEVEKKEALSIEKIRQDRVAKSVQKEITVMGDKQFEGENKENNREYPDGAHQNNNQATDNHKRSSLNDRGADSYSTFHSKWPPTDGNSRTRINSDKPVYYTGIRISGGNHFWGYVKKIRVKVAENKGEFSEVDVFNTGLTNTGQIRTINFPKPVYGKHIEISSVGGRYTNNGWYYDLHGVYRWDYNYKKAETKTVRMLGDRMIDDEGYYISPNGTRLPEDIKDENEKKLKAAEELQMRKENKAPLKGKTIKFNGEIIEASDSLYKSGNFLVDKEGFYSDIYGKRIEPPGKRIQILAGGSTGNNVYVGDSPLVRGRTRANSVTVDLPDGVSGVDPIPINPEYTKHRDRFRPVIANGRLTVTRTDNNGGWGQKLVFRGIVSESYFIGEEKDYEVTSEIKDLYSMEGLTDLGLMEDVEFEQGFSKISSNWAKKYSDTTIRLNRWVSGISEWGNHVYKGFKDKLDYKKINDNKDFYFNTEKGGNGNSPGCGEFSYPSDIAITKKSCLGNNIQFMMVTDTGNNRISIFKKYNLDGNMRFRFYSFLGDEEEKVENKTFVSPISICISEVSGNVFVLEANFFNNIINKAEKTDGNPSQRIKVFYPDLKKKNYFWSHNIEINKFTLAKTFNGLKNMYKGDNEKDTIPRITKIRIDDRGILALTDIHNNKVHLLKESISAEFEIKKIDDSALNKVSIDIDYDPYKKLKSYDDRNEYPLINHDRIRFIFQRQRVCAFQNGDVIVSREFKTGNIPFGDYKKSFHIEDIREQLEYDNCWVMNTETGMKYLPIDNIETDESTGEKLRVEVNRPNYDIDKKYLKDGTLVNYEDWRGRSLEPNSSYLYKIFAYNYNFIQDTESDTSTIVQTYPLYLSDDDINPRNIVNEKENYISLNINYDYESKKYNPICFTIFRRIHNRTMDIVTKNINCVKGSKIQLFLPRQSKIIFQIKSRPKLGRLYYYDIEKGGEFEKNLVELEIGVEYAENKYLIFYSCEGGDEKIGGYTIPDQKAIGRDSINDTFTLGDRLETVHNQVKYNVMIDITKTDTNPIMFKDNEYVDDNLRYYKKSPVERDSTDMEKLVKLSYAKKVEDENYFYPGIIEYCDKGINLGPDNIRPIEMNQTYEYVILVSNPFKVNPAVNSFYYTTKPEKPYIHSVEFDKLALENNANLFTGSELKNDNPNDNKVTIDGGEDPNELSIAKVTWYYPKNRSLYWPLNFLVLRKDVSNRPIAIKPNTYDIDFNFVARPIDSDKLFRIKKKSLKLLNNSDTQSTGIFKRRYNLQKQIDWRIKIFGTPGIDIMVNKEKYNWSEPYIELKQTKFLDLTIKLQGQQQITNITCEETVIVGEEEDLDSVSKSPSSSANPEKLKQIEQYKKEQEKHQNQKLIAAVEEHRKSSNINFIFNLGDDYHGYYSNVANAPRTGKNGSLYRYIKEMSKDKLLDIFDELHNEMKIYHGDVGLRMDGSNTTLRSGDREMLIDKIRHFAFILREHKKSEQKAMGVECTPLELDDIKIVSSMDGDKEPKVEAIVCKNIETDLVISPAPTNTNTNIDINQEDSLVPALTAVDSILTKRCSTLEETGLRGDDKQVITNVTTLADCCYKCQMSSDCEVAEFKESEKMCELHRNYDPANEIPGRPNSTLLGKEADTFVLPPVETSLAPAEEEVIPPHLSEWEVVKTIYRKKEVIADYTFRYPKQVGEKDRLKIQKEFAFEPTIVSLSSDPEGLLGGPPSDSENNIDFSSHEVSIPIPKGKKYSYKIAVFQTGFNLDTEEKRKFMGVETKKTPLGLGEVYSNEIELGESITETIIINKPPFMPLPMFKEPKVDRPVIKFFEPKEGDSNSIVRIVGLKLDEIEYFCFRDVKVKVVKKQERIIGNVKYQEYLVKPPSIKELDRKCWQSIEKYRVLVWGYWHGYQIINSENGEKNKMFSYISSGECNYDEEKK